MLLFQRRAPSDIRSVALRMIEAHGVEAGLIVTRIFHFAGLDGPTASRMKLLAEEIERIQGFGWYVATGEAS